MFVLPNVIFQTDGSGSVPYST